ncbi:MAG: hypothetical protein K8T90_15360 [Planctomycetes bacterium]|nr:hypothetical protein [Planctomycetota bacterium]
MDQIVIDALVKAQIEIGDDAPLPIVGIQLDRERHVVSIADEVTVVSGERVAVVTLKPADQLFTGDRKPPDFAKGPTAEYVTFFAMIELTAADFCASTKTVVRDREFERLYNHLRRRPDGSDPHPIFSYLRAAARLHMSLHDVSRDEYEAVLRRLTRSARTYSEGPVSANYLDLVLTPMLR